MSIRDDNRPEPPFSAPPKEMVEAFLDYLRATLLWKVEGLSDEELRRPFPPSSMTLLGMIQHIAYVERWWFRIVFAGEELPSPWTEDDPDADWRVPPFENAAAIITLYKREIEYSRAIVAAASWNDPAKKPGRNQTLGWILTHMVEETARHCGHADLFREQIDGKTGECDRVAKRRFAFCPHANVGQCRSRAATVHSMARRLVVRHFLSYDHISV